VSFYLLIIPGRLVRWLALSGDDHQRGRSGARLAHVAQMVEHVLGKDEVIGSIPIVGSSPLSGWKR
jgi:hypothetical protein